jgi:hypothetical protein
MQPPVLEVLMMQCWANRFSSKPQTTAGKKWCFDFDPGQFHVIGVLIIYMNGLHYLGGI